MRSKKMPPSFCLMEGVLRCGTPRGLETPKGGSATTTARGPIGSS